MGLYLGVFLVTLSGLMLEIGLTRIFSATIWYHFAFVAISVALLGWGAGGFALHVSRARIAFTRERAALLTLLYGLSIPLALWLIVQHLTLLLGHPIFTLSILLFTLLASGGLGSASDGRRPLRDVCLAVGVLAAAYALALPRVVPALLPLPLGLRIAIAIAVIAPLGFLMGMPFPRGLRATGQGPFPAPSFYWGLNGIFSVVGSMATMVAAVVAGFTWAMLGGAAFYLLAALASLTFGRAPGGALGASAGRKGEAYGS